MTESARGLLLALVANLMWGLMPVFWKLFEGINASEVLAHRTLWSLVFTSVLLYGSGGFVAVRYAMRDNTQRILLLLSSVLIASNWLAYIWAVVNGQVIAASLGYFLSPLISVCFGVIFFHERLRAWQWAAVLMAISGVMAQIFVVGQLPWLGLFLALTFAAYGVVRKKCRCDSLSGLFAETLLLTPFALGFMVWLQSQSLAGFLNDGLHQDVFFALSGVVTALPLLLFVAGSRRLKYSTIGLLFYLTPSLQFLLGLFVYDEWVTQGEWMSFGLIWMALVVYSYEGRRYERGRRIVNNLSTNM